jgi:putative pyruvate formate lyase activating enzyme
MKYGDSQIARKYSKVRDYVAFNRAAVTEMHRQVGELVLDARGVARRGLLVRHLLLPNRLSDSEKVLSFIANKLSTHTYVNLMDQYYPCYRAGDYALLRRPLDKAEYQAALRLAEHYGLHRLDRRQPV